MVGVLVKEARKRQKLTQVELARRAGVSQNYISKLENGEIELPQRGTMEALGAPLNLTVGDFYRAAGMLEGVEETSAPQLIQLPLSDPDESFDAEAIVAYVESRPGQHFQDRLRRRREALRREDYVRLCISLFRAWSSNSDLALSAWELRVDG